MSSHCPAGSGFTASPPAQATRTEAGIWDWRWHQQVVSPPQLQLCDNFWMLLFIREKYACGTGGSWFYRSLPREPLWRCGSHGLQQGANASRAVGAWRWSSMAATVSWWPVFWSTPTTCTQFLNRLRSHPGEVIWRLSFSTFTTYYNFSLKTYEEFGLSSVLQSLLCTHCIHAEVSLSVLTCFVTVYKFSWWRCEALWLITVFVRRYWKWSFRSD